MKLSEYRIVSVSIFCLFLTPFAVAEEIQIAKVYRDYPGYIEAPTCSKPRITSSSIKHPAVKNSSGDMLAVEGSSAKIRAKKVYRDYPGYLETPTCVNPRLSPGYDNQPVVAAEKSVNENIIVTPLVAVPVIEETLSAEIVAAEKVATEKVATEKVATEKVATEKVVAEQLAAEKIAAEKVAAEKVSAEKVAAEKVAAEKVAAEKVAAEKVAAEKVAAEKVAAEKVAAEKVAAEKVAAEKVAAEKVAAEKVAAEKVAAVHLAAADEKTANKMAANMISDDNKKGPSEQTSELMDGHFYAGGWAGLASLNSDDLDNSSSSIDLEYDNGYGAGLLVGYDFGTLRFDLEGSYRTSDIDDVSVNNVDASSVSGDLEVEALILNGYYDFETDSSVTPYIGAGIGFADVSFNSVDAQNVRLVDDSDTAFAWQISVGSLFALNETATLDVGYRYLATDSLELNSANGKLDTEIKSHAFIVGLKFYF